MREHKYKVWYITEQSMSPPATLKELISFGIKYMIPTLNLLTSDIIFLEYTGLTDKNGKEIYEGDILEIDGRAWHERGEVIFDKGSFIFKQFKGWKKDQAIVQLYDIQFENWTVEVIGNIYQNPELLETK